VILPDGAPIAASNQELYRLVNDGSSFNGLVVGLTGGDLHRTVGGSSVAGRLHTDDAYVFPVDVIEVELDEARTMRFVAHLVGHDRGFRRGIAAMNVDSRGAHRLGPHAHPGDAVVDVYTYDLAWGDVWRVAPRAKLGTHVPHPRIALQRAALVDVVLPRPVPVRADDVRVGNARRLRFTVLPDAIRIVV
jgi:ATP-dependent Clp protease adapter protein ClpS